LPVRLGVNERSVGSVSQFRQRATATRLAAEIAEARGLTFYDSAYAAGARSRGAALATADQALLSAGAGERAGAIAARLGT